MANNRTLDCVVIGYNEVPFAGYESFLRNFGEESEAYRDLKFSFVNVGGRKMDYIGLMNHAAGLAKNGGEAVAPHDEYKSGEIPNLAAAYLSNFLRRRGHRARYVNLFQYEKERLIEYLDPDATHKNVVAVISGITPEQKAQALKLLSTEK